MRHHTLCTSIFWYCKMVDFLSAVLSSEQYSEQHLGWISDFIWPREVPSSSVWYKECFWEKQPAEEGLSGSEKSGKMCEMIHGLLNFERTQRIIAEDSTYFRPYTCFANRRSDHRRIPPFHVLLVLVVKEETTEQRLQSSIILFQDGFVQLLDNLPYYVNTTPNICYVAQALGLLHFLHSLLFILQIKWNNLFSVCSPITSNLCCPLCHSKYSLSSSEFKTSDLSAHTISISQWKCGYAVSS